METRAHHVLIGLFTLVVVVAALLFALWLAKAGSEKQAHRYDIVFQEAVSGLTKGSTVEFNGIKVGEVSSLRLDPEDPRRVFARVSVDSTAPIRRDTRARLVPAGITGMYLIRLTSGDDPGSPPLRPQGEEVPVIVASPSPMSRLLADGEDVIYNVNEILVQARALFSAENVGKVSSALANLDQATGALAAQRDELGRAVQQLALAGDQANRALSEASRVMASTSRLIDGSATRTLESAQGAMLAFERAMRTVDTLVADNRGQLDSGMRGLGEIGPAVAELGATLAALRSITRKLEDRPADYLLGLEPTKEFQP